MKNEIKWIEKRIEKLNERIDTAIIAGKSYAKLAREHADLRAYLKTLSA